MTRLLSVLALFGLWMSLTLVLPDSVVPAPREVGAAIYANVASGEAVFHVSRTLLRVVLGMGFAMVLGMMTGVTMGLSRSGEAFLDVWVTVGLTVPAIVYGMICLLWFGLNDLAAIVAVGLTAFPSVGVSIWQGVKAVDRDLIDMGRVFRFNKTQILGKIVLPQLIPHVLAAMRFALGISWKVCTTIELIGLSSGVGYMLHYWFGLFSMTQVFAWTMLFLGVMLVIELAIFKPIEARLVRWRPPLHV